MKIKKLNVFKRDPKSGVSNEYQTSENSFRQPCLWYISAVRNSGKSFLCSKFLAQAKKDKTFDKIYMITPSFASNKAYFGDYINEEEDVYDPTKDSIDKVIKRVEDDRDAWEEFLAQKKMYKEFKKLMKSKKQIETFDEELLLSAYEKEFMEHEPEWRYEFETPPRSLLIMDDVINSPAILQSSGLGRIATLNRHLSQLKEEHSGRSACGLAVIILSQSYRTQNGIGRLLRENLSLFTVFLNKQKKQMEAIEDEIGSVVDLDKFKQAYDYATKEKYGNLTIDFQSKCPSKVFRKNLNEAIVFEGMDCNCKNKNK